MSRPIRVAARAAAITAALAATLGAASAEAAQTAKLEYQCTWPQVGTQPVTVELSADIPAAKARTSYPREQTYKATFTLGGDTAAGLGQIDGLARIFPINSLAGGIGSSIAFKLAKLGGAASWVSASVNAGIYNVVPPNLVPIEADQLYGTIPVSAIDQNGTWTLTAGEMLLNFQGQDASGAPVPAFKTPATGPGGAPVSDVDGDPDTATIPCKLDAAGSDTLLAEMRVTDAPTAPTGLTAANVTASSADLSWGAATDPDGSVAEYRVLDNRGQVLATTSDRSVRIEGLEPDTAYSVTVVAVDDLGVAGAYSSPVYSTFRTARVHGDANLSYRCKFPALGTSTVVVQLDTDLPKTATAGTPIAASAVRVELVQPGRLELVGPQIIRGPLTLSTVTDAEKPGKGTALGLRASGPGGATAELRVPVSPAAAYEEPYLLNGFTFDTSGTLPAVQFDAPGTAAFDATSLTLNLRAVDASGSPVARLVTPTTDLRSNPYADIDGDPATFNVPCELVASTDPRIATTVVARALPPGVVKYGYSLKGTTKMKTLTSGTLQLTGSIGAELTLATGAIAADLQLADTSGRLVSFGFLPVTAKIGFSPSGKTTGSLVDGVLKTNSKVRIKVKEVKLFGAIPLVAGNNCQTRSLTDISLQSTEPEFSPLVGGPIAGSFKISDLNGCGPMDGMVSPLTAGGGNTIALNLTPQS